MNIWKRIRKSLTEKNIKQEEKDIIFPESKGIITLEALKKELVDIDDIIIKDIMVGQEKATLIFLKTMTNLEVFQETILNPLDNMTNGYEDNKLKLAEKVEPDGLPELIYDITRGYTVLFFQGDNKIIKVDTKKTPTRNITAPENETTVLGPSDAFTENLDQNIGLIRKRIANSQLKVKNLILGTETRNEVSVLYMGNIANKENIDRVLYRLNNIEIQGIWGISTLKQILEDKPFSPIPQLGLTVRPDNVVSALLDGRIVIMLNNSPEAITAPITFFEMFSSTEDYYGRWPTITLLRLLRFGGFFLTITLTPLYISLLTYHPEMLPSPILKLLIESRMKVPFPPVIEVLIIEVVIEVLREAGARMPTKIGQTIGIVGGIVIGTAAVDAGLASNILIVLVSLSALLSFLPPSFLMSNASRVIRYIFIIVSGFFGLYGQLLILAWLMAHLANLTSLGTPLMAPVIPRTYSDLFDSVFRAPIYFLYKRKGMSRAKKQLIRPLDEE